MTHLPALPRRRVTRALRLAWGCAAMCFRQVVLLSGGVPQLVAEGVSPPPPAGCACAKSPRGPLAADEHGVRLPCVRPAVPRRSILPGVQHILRSGWTRWAVSTLRRAVDRRRAARQLWRSLMVDRSKITPAHRL